MTRPTPKFPVGTKVRSTGVYPQNERIDGLLGTIVGFHESHSPQYPYEVNWGERSKTDWLHSERELEVAE